MIEFRWSVYESGVRIDKDGDNYDNYTMSTQRASEKTISICGSLTVQKSLFLSTLFPLLKRGMFFSKAHILHSFSYIEIEIQHMFSCLGFRVNFYVFAHVRLWFVLLSPLVFWCFFSRFGALGLICCSFMSGVKYACVSSDSEHARIPKTKQSYWIVVCSTIEPPKSQ